MQLVVVAIAATATVAVAVAVAVAVIVAAAVVIAVAMVALVAGTATATVAASEQDHAPRRDVRGMGLARYVAPSLLGAALLAVPAHIYRVDHLQQVGCPGWPSAG